MVLLVSQSRHYAIMDEIQTLKHIVEKCPIILFPVVWLLELNYELPRMQSNAGFSCYNIT